MAEHLKPLQQVHEPDPRFRGYTMLDHLSGERRPLTIGDHHRWIAESTLHSLVPAEVRSVFVGGQNLTLYAWFVYPIMASAQLQFAGCLEQALRIRQGMHHDRSAARGLGKLLTRANQEGVLAGIRFRDPDQLGWIPGPGGDETHEQWFYDRIGGILQIFRNELAHGRPMLLADGGAFMRLTADAVNHLFAPTGSGHQHTAPASGEGD